VPPVTSSESVSAGIYGDLLLHEEMGRSPIGETEGPLWPRRLTSGDEWSG
jgi:hypothetical protein